MVVVVVGPAVVVVDVVVATDVAAAELRVGSLNEKKKSFALKTSNFVCERQNYPGSNKTDAHSN